MNKIIFEWSKNFTTDGRRGAVRSGVDPRGVSQRALSRASMVFVLSIAMLTFAAGVQAADTVTYYYTDAQGTVLAKADAAGTVINTPDYRPYGAQALGTPEDGPGYTGHVNDVNSGLVYMQARYYDPQIGRFLSTDPVSARAGGDNFNKYSYALNNPYRFLDPDGKDVNCVGSSCVLAPIGGNLPSVSFARPDGFPDQISESASMFHHVYNFNDSAGQGDTAYAQRVNNELIQNPTPILNSPATREGSLIDVNATNAISMFTGVDHVMSYQVPLSNGSNAVLNVTTGDHAASWGVVFRMTQSSSDGRQSIVTYGEGNSMLQSLFDNNNSQSQSVWSQSAEDITRRANSDP